MTEGSAKQITSTSAAAVSVEDASCVRSTEGLRPAGTLRIREDTENSVEDASYVRSAEGLQSAEEQIGTVEWLCLRASHGGDAAGGDAENTC